MEQTLNKSKSWKLPFWFMLGISVFHFLEDLFVFPVFFHIHLFPLRRDMLSILMIWPSLLFTEAVIYWLIRKRMYERKWVWAHLLFSLFAFVLLWVLYCLVAAIFYYINRALLKNAGLMNNIKFYCFWAGIVVGHIFFIVAIVRSFSYKNALASPDVNDFLNEL
jgi:hypothetical protein